MNKSNSFLYSNDNKRYHTWNYYLKQRFHQKVFKVALNAGFTCPNRDGTCGQGGCIFCGSMGSGEYAGNFQEDLSQQYLTGIFNMQKKWPTGIPIPYFQAYTNTYASIDKLKEIYTPFLESDDIQAICIATRADCLDEEKIKFFDSYTHKKEIWIELGLQSIHDQTADFINRGHTYQQFLDCINILKNTNLKVCVHIINSLPYESKKMMLETMEEIASLPIHAVKIHMLFIMEDSKLANIYHTNPFHILSKEEYIDIVIQQLELLPAHMIIQRLTGDSMKEKLIAPLWTLNKISVLNDIDKEMKKRNTWQGKYAIYVNKDR